MQDKINHLLKAIKETKEWQEMERKEIRKKLSFLNGVSVEGVEIDVYGVINNKELDRYDKEKREHVFTGFRVEVNERAIWLIITCEGKTEVWFKIDELNALNLIRAVIDALEEALGNELEKLDMIKQVKEKLN